MIGKMATTFAAAVLVAGCVSQSTYKAEVAKADTYQSQASANLTKANTFQALSQQLQAELKSDQVQIQQLQNQVKLTLVDSLLFPEGGWQIHRKGEETLDKIVPTLKTVTTGRVVVEGFTDNVPIGPALRARFPSNWELSTARASDVVRYLSEKGVSKNVLAAEGFGDSRPVATNDTPEGRAKNRRVEIVISGLDQ